MSLFLNKIMLTNQIVKKYNITNAEYDLEIPKKINNKEYKLEKIIPPNILMIRIGKKIKSISLPRIGKYILEEKIDSLNGKIKIKVNKTYIILRAEKVR